MALALGACVPDGLALRWEVAGGCRAGETVAYVFERDAAVYDELEFPCARGHAEVSYEEAPIDDPMFTLRVRLLGAAGQVLASCTPEPVRGGGYDCEFDAP